MKFPDVNLLLILWTNHHHINITCESILYEGNETIDLLKNL